MLDFEEAMAREQFEEDLRSDRDRTADKVFDAIKDLGFAYFIDMPVAREKKIMSVESSIHSFREREMYEQCAFLKGILDTLGRNEDGSHKT